MLSKYFEIKTNSESFKTNLKEQFDFLKDKKVIIYGAGEAFCALNKIYDFKNKLNVIALADKKFEKNNQGSFKEIKSIAPNEITSLDFDYILIANENAIQIENYLLNVFNIKEEKIKRIFNYKISKEQMSVNYLFDMKFDKTLPKLIKKLKNKTVMIYGAGIFFEAIKEFFDISNLNIIGISDKRFEKNSKEEFLGYKTYAPEEIREIKPDYVLVATKFYINILEDLYYETLKGTKIKLKPLVKKPFMTLMREIWG